MSRRTKLIILALFLALLSIPGIYIALSWNPPNPFEFSYVGRGAPVMHNFDPRYGEEVLCVPFLFEVRNTRPYPIHLWEMRIIGDIVPLPASPGSSTGSLGISPTKDLHIGLYRVIALSTSGSGSLFVERSIPPIRAYGTMRVEILVPTHLLPQIDPASLHVEYESISATKKQGQQICFWLNKVVWHLFAYDIRVIPQPTRHTAPLQDAARLHTPPDP